MTRPASSREGGGEGRRYKRDINLIVSDTILPRASVSGSGSISGINGDQGTDNDRHHHPRATSPCSLMKRGEGRGENRVEGDPSRFSRGSDGICPSNSAHDGHLFSNSRTESPFSSSISSVMDSEFSCRELSSRFTE